MLLLALALIGPSSAVAASEGTYTAPVAPPTTPTTPATPTPTSTPTTPTTTPTPSTGTSPSKEETSPATPASNETSPSNTSTPAKASAKAGTLPFTGFDLRWSLAIGVLLIAAGFSIVAMQRRQRRDTGR
jgi:hypothetical protein